MTQKQLVVTIVEAKFQSQSCLTIHHTYDETLEGSSCCEALESVQTHLILVWKVGVCLATFVPTHDSKTGGGDHFRPWIPISSLCIHLLYSWWDIGRVELLWIGWIGTNTLNLGVKSRGLEVKVSTAVTQKSGWRVGMVMHIKFQSQPCKTIHHTCHEILEGSSCCKMPEPVQTHLILVWKVGMCHQAEFPQSWL